MARQHRGGALDFRDWQQDHPGEPFPVAVALGADPHSVALVLTALVVFFSAFNVMEASLPSLVSKAAPADATGTAMGVYSSSQFFGIFLDSTL